MERSRVARWVAIAMAVALFLSACGGSLPEGATGQEIYDARCASCHRKDLSGAVGPALGSGSAAAGKPDESYELTITEGRGRMPSFGGVFTDQQIADVIAYIRNVQAGGDQ